MSNFLDKWNKNKFNVYDSEEKTLLKLITKISDFILDLSKGVDNKTDLLGDHKGSWQGINKPTLSEEGLRGTVEKLNNDLPILENNIEKITELTIKYNVMNYDFDNTGVNDNSEKLNNLIKLVYDNGGGVIEFPQGKFKLLTSITCLPTVYLRGNMPWRGKGEQGYTVIECYSLDKPQFLLREYCSLENFYFNYPNQANSDSNIPIQYEWTISTDTTHLCDDIQLKDLFFNNSYKAISLVRGGRFNLKNIYGQPISRGILLDDSRDINNFDRIEFWTFTNYVDTQMYNYILNNAIAFEFKKTDGVICNNLFAYGYNIGFNFNGEVWGTFNGCSLDKCKSPIIVNNCNMVEIIGGSFIGYNFKSIICNIKNVTNNFKLIGANMFGGCGVGVLNYSQNGKILIDVNFKNNDDKIYIPVINNSDNEITVRKNNFNDKIYGYAVIDGVKNYSSATLIKTYNKSNFGFTDTGVTDLTDSIRFNLGNVINGEKIYSGICRVDDDSLITNGLYIIEFNVGGKITTDRKRLTITIGKDDGSKVYNYAISQFPYIEETTKIRLPVYLGNKPYITQLKLSVSYYNEPIATGDYIDISNVKLYKLNNYLYSTLDLFYQTSYSGDDKINYEFI